MVAFGNYPDLKLCCYWKVQLSKTLVITVYNNNCTSSGRTGETLNGHLIKFKKNKKNITA